MYFPTNAHLCKICTFLLGFMGKRSILGIYFSLLANRFSGVCFASNGLVDLIGEVKTFSSNMDPI